MAKIDKTKLGLIFASIISLILLGVFLNQFIKTTTSLEGQDYILDFNILPKSDLNGECFHINNFSIYYHFTKREGKISFIPTKEVDYIDIDFPTFIDNQTIEFYIENKKQIKGEDYVMNTKNNPSNNPRHTTLILSDIKQSIKNKGVIIRFDADWEPKGRFYFLTSQKINLYSNEGQIHFIFGKDYTCIPPCLGDFNFRNIEPRWDSYDDDLKFKFIEENENKDFGFKISAISEKARKKKDLALALMIFCLTLLVSIIFTCIQLYHKKNKKDNLF